MEVSRVACKRPAEPAVRRGFHIQGKAGASRLSQIQNN
jgi:hypothetical protein